MKNTAMMSTVPAHEGLNTNKKWQVDVIYGQLRLHGPFLRSTSTTGKFRALNFFYVDCLKKEGRKFWGALFGQ